MRRLALMAALAGSLMLPATAWAHPSDENRSPVSFHGGPHCHTNLKSGQTVFPSHMAHMKQLGSGPAGAIFGAPFDCP